MTHVLITGAAGFIGSHLVDCFLDSGFRVTGIDNLSRGSRRHLSQALSSTHFHFYDANLASLAGLPSLFETALAAGPVDLVWHMAANSDIAAGATDPLLDLNDTFLSTFHLLSMMRRFGMRRLAFASSSAVYGNHAGAVAEDSGPLLPVSNYGAMKLAAEGIISAAAQSFLEQAWILRLPNVVGPRATHGIIYDLMHKLAANPRCLEVLGDGAQQKPYLHVTELIDAMLFLSREATERRNVFNIGASDQGATVKYITEAVIRRAAPDKPIRYTGGRGGWSGDVPRYHYSIDKLAKLGWTPRLSSEAAVDRAVGEIYDEVRPVCS